MTVLEGSRTEGTDIASAGTPSTAIAVAVLELVLGVGEGEVGGFRSP